MADTFEDEQEQFLNTLTEEAPAAVVETPEEEWYTAAQVAELRQQEREAAAEEARQVAEAQFNERRGAIDANHNKVLEAIRAAGIDYNAKSGVSFNPNQVLATMFGGQQQQTGGKQELPQVEAYDPDSIKAYTAQVVQQALAEQQSAFNKQLEMLSNVQAQSILPSAMATAAPFFEEMGVAGLQNTPECAQAFNYAYSQLPLDQRLDPLVIQGVASYALAATPKEVREKVRADAEKGRTESAAQAERDRQRAALGLSQTQGQPGRANSVAEWQAGQNNQVLQNFLAATADNPAVDKDMARALMAGTLANGQKAVDVLAAKRAREKAAAKR